MEQSSQTYHAAWKAEYQPLTVELTADVFVICYEKLFIFLLAVFAKVRFWKFTSLKIVPKVRFAVKISKKKGKNVLHRR